MFLAHVRQEHAAGAAARYSLPSTFHVVLPHLLGVFMHTLHAFLVMATQPMRLQTWLAEMSTSRLQSWPPAPGCSLCKVFVRTAKTKPYTLNPIPPHRAQTQPHLLARSPR